MSGLDGDQSLLARFTWTGLVVRTAVGLGFAALFLIFRYLVGLFFPNVIPLSLTFPAALIATLLAGRAAGAVCVLAAQVLSYAFLLPAAARPHIDPGSIFLSVASGLFIVAFAGRHRNLSARLLAAKKTESEDRLNLLETERRRLSSMFEQAPAIITLTEGPEHVLVLSNAAHRRLVGREEVLGRRICDIEPGGGAGFLAIFDEVFRTGRARSGEDLCVSYPRPEGRFEERRFDFVLEPLLDEEGAVRGVFALVIDVTERVGALARLKASEARFRAAVDAVEGVLWTNSAAGEMIGEQPGWARLTGQTFAEYQGYGWAEAVHPDDRQPTVDAWNAAVAARGTFIFEHRLRRWDGALRTFSIRGVPLTDETGEVVQWVGVHTDVTERRRDELALRDLNANLARRVEEAVAERNLFASLVENTDALVVVADLDLKVLAVNRAAVEHVRAFYGREIRVGDALAAILEGRPDDVEEARRIWMRALSGEEFTSMAEFPDGEGLTRTYEVRFNVLRDGSGAPIGAYQFVYDVTERIREQRRLAAAEEQLTQSLKMEAMGQLTGGVAHDFNNLLTPILGALDTLQRRGLGGEREQRLISAALQSTERAQALVQRLLAFARRQPLTTKPVDVGALIVGLFELLDSTLGPQIEIRTEIEPQLPSAEADPSQLETAILNLALNARDAISGSGTVRVGAELLIAGPGGEPVEGGEIRPGPYVRIFVADTGVGMDASTRARVVEPFFTTKPAGKGTGLGLSMAHGLARQLGGGLRIESRPGHGTTVAFLIPAAAAAVEDKKGPVADDRPEAPALQVLLVDDEELVRLATASMLIDLGYGVVEACSAEEALSLVAGGLRPELLITDHKMPGLTGAELARELKIRFPKMPALLISGFADEAAADSHIPLLPKPFRRADLARSLSAVAPAAGRA